MNHFFLLLSEFWNAKSFKAPLATAYFTNSIEMHVIRLFRCFAIKNEQKTDPIDNKRLFTYIPQHPIVLICGASTLAHHPSISYSLGQKYYPLCSHCVHIYSYPNRLSLLYELTLNPWHDKDNSLCLSPLGCCLYMWSLEISSHSYAHVYNIYM